MPQYIEFFQNHPLLVMAFIGLFVGLMWTLVAGRSQGLRRVGAMEATRLINSDDALVVDVRSDAEFRQGHIINAINVPEKQLDGHAEKLDKHRTRPLIMVCRTGQSAARVGAALRKRGFESIYTLDGGLTSWQAASLPLAKK